jgi:hypothetical protein
VRLALAALSLASTAAAASADESVWATPCRAALDDARKDALRQEPSLKRVAARFDASVYPTVKVEVTGVDGMKTLAFLAQHRDDVKPQAWHEVR